MSHPFRAVAAACLLAGLAACGRAPEGDPAAAGVAKPPIVLISVDTLRSDRLRLYHPEGVATPALERLRADGTLYTQAFSPLPMTLPAHLTALTGLLPAHHGVRDNGGFRFDAASHPYLPRRLAEAGYATGAFVSSFVLRGNSGMAAGFDVYDDELIKRDDSPFALLSRPGEETLGRALEWIEEVRDEPFFLFLHLYEPHLPHEAPAEFAARFTDPYDAEVAYSDSLLAELLEQLDLHDLYDPALIVFMSDHGEGLGDHGYRSHGLLLYREALQVPLVVKQPRGKNAGTTIDHAVQLADVAPTIEQLAGLEVTGSIDGLAVHAEAPASSRPLLAETFVPRLHYGWSELGSVIDLPYHLIWGPDPELYDLENDPGEENDLFTALPDVVRELARARRGYDWAVPQPAAEDAETMANLEALGYLAGSTGTLSDESPPDPKSRLPLLDQLTYATARFHQGEREEAVELLRRIVDEAPEIIAAWENLGKSLLQMGRTDEAIDALEEAMRRSNGRALIALELAKAHWRAGDLEAARSHAEIAANTHDLAHGLLAQIALKQGDLEAALRHVEPALEVAPIRDQALLTRAEVELESAPETALATLAEVSTTTLTDLELVRGRTLAKLDRLDEAESAFLRQIERHPGVLDGYTYLAYFYSVRGDGARAGRTLQAMVAANDTPAAYAAAVNTLRLVGDPSSADRLLDMALGRWPDASRLTRLRAGGA